MGSLLGQLRQAEDLAYDQLRHRPASSGFSAYSCGTNLPSHDVAREVVEHCRQMIPAPTGNLEVGEVRLPELINGGGSCL